MTTKHKWPAEEIDRRIDRALQAMTSSTPPSDLRARVMGHIANATDARPFSWRFAYAAAAAVVFIAALTMWPGREQMPQTVNRDVAQQQPTNPGASAQTGHVPDQSAPPAVVARAGEIRTRTGARRPTRTTAAPSDAELYALPPLAEPSELDVGGIATVAAVVTPIDTESIGIARLNIDPLRRPQ